MFARMTQPVVLLLTVLLFGCRGEEDCVDYEYEHTDYGDCTLDLGFN